MTQQTRHNKFNVNTEFDIATISRTKKRARRRQRWHSAIILLQRVILWPHYQIITTFHKFLGLWRAKQVSRYSRVFALGLPRFVLQKHKKRTKRKTKATERTFNVLQWNDQHKFHRLAPFSGDGLFIHLHLSFSLFPFRPVFAVSIQKNMIIFMLYSEQKTATKYEKSSLPF